MRLFLTTQKNTVCQHVEPRVGFRTESQTKKSPKALGKQGFCREYFAQIGACGLSCVFLRSCHCCAMERTAGWFPHRKPNKKEPEGSWQTGFLPGILRANRRMRFIVRFSALVPLLRNGANRGLVSAPKAKQKRARRLFFAWYSRWESNPERPLRSCTYFVNRGKYHPFFCKIGIKIGF